MMRERTWWLGPVRLQVRRPTPAFCDRYHGNIVLTYYRPRCVYRWCLTHTQTEVDRGS